MNSIPRFINFIIDSVVYFVIISIVLLIFKNNLEMSKMRYLLISLYYLYYFFSEYFFQMTVGKLITRTKVVSMKDGDKPTFSQILIRTLARIIPIDFVFYFFNYNGIHDILSKTTLKQV